MPFLGSDRLVSGLEVQLLAIGEFVSAAAVAAGRW